MSDVARDRDDAVPGLGIRNVFLQVPIGTYTGWNLFNRSFYARRSSKAEGLGGIETRSPLPTRGEIGFARDCRQSGPTCTLIGAARARWPASRGLCPRSPVQRDATVAGRGICNGPAPDPRIAKISRLVSTLNAVVSTVVQISARILHCASRCSSVKVSRL
jgi:hypothetical protein